MLRNREIIHENPFHPLDLSFHDLLAIYKRFEESRWSIEARSKNLLIDTFFKLIELNETEKVILSIDKIQPKLTVSSCYKKW